MYVDVHTQVHTQAHAYLNQDGTLRATLPVFFYFMLFRGHISMPVNINQYVTSSGSLVFLYINAFEFILPIPI